MHGLQAPWSQVTSARGLAETGSREGGEAAENYPDLLNHEWHHSRGTSARSADCVHNPGGNSVQPPIGGSLPAANGLPAFPNFDASATSPGTVNPLLQTNLIFPVPCEFISADLPHCAVIRPTSAGQIDAMGAVNGLKASGLFIGQPQSFIDALTELAVAADGAKRTGS